MLGSDNVQKSTAREKSSINALSSRCCDSAGFAFVREEEELFHLLNNRCSDAVRLAEAHLEFLLGKGTTIGDTISVSQDAQLAKTCTLIVRTAPTIVLEQFLQRISREHVHALLGIPSDNKGDALDLEAKNEAKHDVFANHVKLLNAAVARSDCDSNARLVDMVIRSAVPALAAAKANYLLQKSTGSFKRVHQQFEYYKLVRKTVTDALQS